MGLCYSPQVCIVLMKDGLVEKVMERTFVISVHNEVDVLQFLDMLLEQGD